MRCRRIPACVAVSLLAIGCSSSSGARSEPAARTVPPPSTCHSQPQTAPAPAGARASVTGLPGSPDGIATTPDGRYAFVAIQSGAPRIAVVRTGAGHPRVIRTIALPATPSGVRVTPNGRYVLAAAGRGAVVIDSAAAIDGAGQPVIGSLSAPARLAGAGPGAAEVAVSAGSRYAFVTLEGAGRVAVFDLRTRAYLGAVPVGGGALGLAVAPDGRRLYEVSESGRAKGFAHIRGVLNVIDIRRAVADPARAVLVASPAPCAPVRVAVSPDGREVWVTARDGNELLGYDSVGALRSVTPVGAAPLGVAVAGSGREVLVADANLGHAAGGRSALSIVDVTSPQRPRLLGSVGARRLADAVAAPGDGHLALLTASDGDALVAVTLP